MRRALHAEWTKLRTTPGITWLLLAVIVTTAGLSLVTTAVTDNPADPVKAGLTGVQLGQAVVAILAVLIIGGEYGTGMIHTSLTAVPRRSTLLTAKALTVTGVVLVAATAGVLPSVLDGWHGRAAVGSVLYLALIGLLALGVATAVRNAASAIGLVLGLLYVFPILGVASTDPEFQRHLQQVGPMAAGLAIQATTGLDALPISPWRGLAVLAAWATAALLAGGLLLRLRDA